MGPLQSLEWMVSLADVRAWSDPGLGFPIAFCVVQSSPITS